MRDLLQQFADTGFTLPEDATWLNGMTEYAEAAIACGDPRFARLLFELLEPFAEQFSSAGGVTAEVLDVEERSRGEYRSWRARTGRRVHV
jgi:hypothetical protein